MQEILTYFVFILAVGIEIKSHIQGTEKPLKLENILVLELGHFCVIFVM